MSEAFHSLFWVKKIRDKYSVFLENVALLLMTKTELWILYCLEIQDFFFFSSWYILLWKGSELYLFHWATLKWGTLVCIWQPLGENKYLCYFFLWIFQTIQKCDRVWRARCVWLQQLEHGWCRPATKQREQSWNSAARVETLDSICHLCQGCYPHNDGKSSYSWSKKWNYIYSNQCCRWDAGLWSERLIMLQVWSVHYYSSSVVDTEIKFMCRWCAKC